MIEKLDTSDPGKAANVAGQAAVLYARTCGMVADNEMRKRRDECPAWNGDDFARIEAEFYEAVKP